MEIHFVYLLQFSGKQKVQIQLKINTFFTDVLIPTQFPLHRTLGFSLVNLLMLLSNLLKL